MNHTGRPRVLVLIKGLGLGGAERLLERSVPYLNREQYDYQAAYLLPWKTALVAPFEAAGIPVHCFNLRVPVDPRPYFRLEAFLRRERIDLVHAHLPVPGILARLAKRRGAVRRVVYTEHSLPSRHQVVTRTLNLATYALNDAVIAVSEAVAGEIRTRVTAGEPPLTTIPNAIDVDGFEHQAPVQHALWRTFGFPDEARVVIHVGNLRPVKGHQYLLAAARRVVEVDPRVRFLLVGVGPLAAQLQEQARRLGLNGHVVFTGFRPDAPALIGAADLFVLASLHEGIPISLLEAMASGRAAVLTGVGGIPEVAVEGETAVFVEPKDVEGLASAILSLLQDPDRRHRMGQNARQYVRRRFGMAAMVGSVEEVYRQVLNA